MPAIKGDMYINTHCNYSQPTLIKLYNENIGGHLTPLHSYGRLLYRMYVILVEMPTKTTNKAMFHFCTVNCGKA